MKRVLEFLIVVSIISMFLITPVAAATSQGLEWGVAKGDKFDFTLTSNPETVNEELYLNVTDTPGTIPDPLTSWGNIPDLDLGAYWANGTSMGMSVLLFLGLITIGGKMVVPTGNFTLLSELIAVHLTGETVEDTVTTWGVEWTQDINSTHAVRISAKYLKSDGFLAEYKMESIESATDTVVSSLTVMRKGLAGDLGFNLPPIIQDNLLYIGAGVAVLVILAVVCKKR